ncbi:CHASE2 domain-containing protein [Sediminitomix flava]|uniref:CHASE2 domain-containing protein n=2 Tax=Sediminitomix flava TaxID=379075 RepID=A0A315ZB23_SEDFL|nr:CHASE2 domain-containing protein [Sediminitomix flava]
MALLSAIHALIMIGGLIFYFSLPYSMADEITLVEITSAIKHALFGIEEKPPRDRYAFVNVSWEKELIDKLDSNDFKIGQMDITNRKSLGKLVKAVNDNPGHEYMLIDVRFYDPAPTDSLLSAELKKAEKLVVSYHKGADDKPHYPIFECNVGLSDMESQVRSNIDDIILKYNIIQNDSLKTTPLVIYEGIHKKGYQSGLVFGNLDGNMVLNTFVMDYLIWDYDLFQAKAYNYYQLGELLMLEEFSPGTIAEYFEDRIVIVGDFEDTDMHKTSKGEMHGPLILLNAFLALERGYNVISWGFLIFLFASFFIISYKALTIKDPVTNYLRRKLPSDHFMIEMASDALFYLAYFAIVSIISYMLFNIQLTILILATYVWAIEKAVISIDELLEEKQKAKEKKLEESIETE